MKISQWNYRFKFHSRYISRHFIVDVIWRLPVWNVKARNIARVKFKTIISLWNFHFYLTRKILQFTAICIINEFIDLKIYIDLGLRPRSIYINRSINTHYIHNVVIANFLMNCYICCATLNNRIIIFISRYFKN
jgi:hypothetical protein